jgi:prephenate dehydrogenase
VRVAVVGNGLMGKSVVLAAERAGFEHVAAEQEADIAVVAVPVGVLSKVVSDVLAATSDGCMVTDVGSTKASVCAAFAHSSRFVGGHPMCGGESPTAELFDGATWFLTKDCALVRSFVTALGATPVIVDPQEHDRLVALTSHLPHAIANLVAHQAARAHVAAGPSLRDITRRAGANPRVWSDIFLDNRKELLSALAAHRQAVSQLEAMLETGDREAVESWISYARPPSSGRPAATHSSLPPG